MPKARQLVPYFAWCLAMSSFLLNGVFSNPLPALLLRHWASSGISRTETGELRRALRPWATVGMKLGAGARGELCAPGGNCERETVRLWVPPT